MIYIEKHMRNTSAHNHSQMKTKFERNIGLTITPAYCLRFFLFITFDVGLGSITQVVATPPPKIINKFKKKIIT